MKVRQGFVSNSSSSSFVVFLKKEDYKEVYNRLSNLEKELVNYLKPTNKKAFGLDIVCISGVSGNCDSFEEFSTNIELTNEEQEALEGEGAHCIFDEKIYKKFLEKDHLEGGEDF